MASGPASAPWPFPDELVFVKLQQKLPLRERTAEPRIMGARLCAFHTAVQPSWAPGAEKVQWMLRNDLAISGLLVQSLN